MQLNKPPAAGSRSSDLVGIPLVITEVKGEQIVDTELGEAEAVVIDVLVLDETGFEGDEVREAFLKHVPDVLIFWKVVRRQLLSDDFNPPTAGKFVQHGRAYTLDELSPDELRRVEALI